MTKEEIHEKKNEKLTKLKKQKGNIEQMLKYKNLPLKKAFLNLTVEENGKNVSVVFPLSVKLGKETLLKDIEEDKEKLKLLEKEINRKEK